jgi:peptide chain release factor subunit 1
LSVQEALERLLHFRSPDAPVVSTYVTIPVDPGEQAVETRFHSLLDPLHDVIDARQLSHFPRESLRADLSRILEIPRRGDELRPGSIAVFACHQEDLYEEIRLPRPVRERVVVDATPYTRPLLAVLDECHRYCVAVVDRERSLLYTFHMGELEEEDKVRDRVLRKPDYAGFHGLEEHRVRNKAEELARKHFKKTAAEIEDFMNATGAELLLVGGHDETIGPFLELLPQQLRSRVVATFTVDPHTITPGKLRQRAEQHVEAYERHEERQLVAEALERVAAGGFAASGLAWCLTAVDEKAVQLLLVHDDHQVAGRACDNCGWLGLDGSECPVCGRHLRPTPDVIDEMAEAVVEAGGKVEHVYADTELATHLVAATLRFPVARP